MFQEVGQEDKGKRVAAVTAHGDKAEERRKRRQVADRKGNRDARGLELCCSDTTASNHTQLFQFQLE